MNHDEIMQEFTKAFPDRSMPGGGELQLPPKIAMELGVEFLDYKKGQSLTGRFIVQEKHTNPMGVLQGGVLTAMFDNIIGPLSYLAARNPATTLELSTNYLRSARPGESVTISAYVKGKGNRNLFIEAQAFNIKEKLMATCTSHILILKK